MSDAELARARPDQIEEAIAAHSRAAKRITALPDPGRGLPRAEAHKARQAQLATMEAQADEIERLRTAYEMTSPEAVRKARFVEDMGRTIRRKGIAKATKPSDREFIAMLNENLLAKQRERETRAKIREKGELMTHPPDPRAASITAAVMADEELWDGLHRRLRLVRAVSEFGTEREMNAVERVYEPVDVSVLYVILKLLEEHDEVKIIEPAQGARFGIPELPGIPKLMASVSHLRANGLLAYKIESGEARVTYGPRIREIAKQWGITLRQPETAKEAVQATA